MKPLLVLAAFVRRDWQVAVSYRTVFYLGLFQGVAALALFYFLGKIVETERISSAEGLDTDYFGFVTIGLVVFTIVHVALTSFAAKLQEEQTTGTFEALMTTPTPPSLIVLSSAAYDLIRALVEGLVMLGLAAAIFGLGLDADLDRIGIALLILAGAIGLFAALGILVAAATVLFKRAGALSGLAALVLSFLGGVYFPINVFPEPLESIAELIPFTWALDALRAALLAGDIDGFQVAGLFGAVAVLLPLSLVAFRAALDRARRTGTLADY